MNGKDLSDYQDLWTTELHRYKVVLMNGVDLAEGGILFDVPSQGLLHIDVDSEVHRAICERMIAAGAPTLTIEEFRKIGTSERR